MTHRWRKTLKNTTTRNDRVRWGPEDHERIRASMKSCDYVERDELLKMKVKGDLWKDIASTPQTYKRIRLPDILDDSLLANTERPGAQ